MQNDSKEDDIYLQYAGVVKRFLISITGNADLSEDLMQETFYQAYKSIRRYNGDCKLSVWLCQIAKHVYFDYLKKEKRRNKFYNEDVKRLIRERNVKSIEETFIAKETFQTFLLIIQSAKNPYGQVFWLRVYEEMSYKEIGEVFEKNENWARVTYYRAKKWIKRRMEYNEDNM